MVILEVGQIVDIAVNGNEEVLRGLMLSDLARGEYLGHCDGGWWGEGVLDEPRPDMNETR